MRSATARPSGTKSNRPSVITSFRRYRIVVSINQKAIFRMKISPGHAERLRKSLSPLLLLSGILIGPGSATAAVQDSATAHWPLAQTESQVARDKVGGYDGYLESTSPILSDSDTGTYFDGSARVQVGALSLENRNALTLSAWVKPTSFSGFAKEARFISKATGIYSHQHSWMLGNGSDGTAVRFRVNTNVGSTTTLTTPRNALKIGRWNHVAATYDGQYMRIFIDGVQRASTRKTGTIGDSGSQNVALGNQPEGAGERGLTGWLADVYILDKAASSSELQSLSNGFSASDETADEAAYEVADTTETSPPPPAAPTVPDNTPVAASQDGNKQYGGMFYGAAKGGYLGGNVAIGYEHSRRFRATKSGAVKSVAYQNRLLTTELVKQRCNAQGAGSMWCDCVANNLDGNACGYTLGSSYHVGNGGSIVVELRTDDGTSQHRPSSTVLGKTRTPFVPANNPANKLVDLEFASPINLEYGKLYHLVFTNLNPPKKCDVKRVDPSKAAQCDTNAGAISLNGTWLGSTPAPSVGHDAGYWGPFYGSAGSETLVQRERNGGWETHRNSLSWYSLKYTDGMDVGDFHSAGWTSSHYGEQNIGGSTVGRQVFVADQDGLDVDGVWISYSHNRYATNTSARMAVKLKNASGQVLASGSFGSSAECRARAKLTDFVQRACRAWGYTSLDRAVSLQKGTKYYLDFSAPSGAGYVLSTTWPFDENDRDSWSSGYAKVSTNGGSTWGSWADGYRDERDIVALFTLVGQPRSLD